MGDNLMAARRFTDSAKIHMDTLLSDARLDTAAAQLALRDIQMHAKSVHARAVYGAAQNALQAIEHNKSQPQIDGFFMSLNKLVAQYTSGLDEISPLLTTPDIVQGAASDEIEHRLVPEDILNNQHVISETLSELLPLVRTPEHRTALDALSRVTAEMTARVSSDLIPNGVAAREMIALDTLIPTVTQTALYVARAHEKSISISSSIEDIHVEDGLKNTITDFLNQAVQHLVIHSLETPHLRQTAGKSSAGYIDITGARQTGGQTFELRIACNGQPARELFLRHESVKNLQALGAHFTFENTEELTAIIVTDIPFSRMGTDTPSRQERPAPRPTDHVYTQDVLEGSS